MDWMIILCVFGEMFGYDFCFIGLGEGFLKLKNDNKIDSKYLFLIFRSCVFRLSLVFWDGSWFGF